MKKNETKKKTISVKVLNPEPETRTIGVKVLNPKPETRTISVKVLNPERKVPVSKRAAVARLKRSLAKDGMILRKARSEAAASQMGEWFIVNDRNHLLADHVDIEHEAREKGLLTPYEYLDD